MDIRESLKYGWKKLAETWWWITLASFYMPIGGALYLLAGFTASRWANNPDILGALNYRTFSSFLKSPVNLKSYIGYTITALVMFLIIYFFAGYIPSKWAANKQHNRVMFQTALIFFILNVTFALLSYLAIATASKQPPLFSFNMLVSQYFLQIANGVFGVTIFILIAVISYIYEKFTVKSALHLVVIYFITITLEFLLLQPFTFKMVANGRVVTPLIGIIMALIYFVFTTIALFISAETVIQDDLGKGTKKGLHLLWARSSILWTYLLVWIITFAISYIVEYFVMLSFRLTHTAPSSSFLTVPAILLTITMLGEAYLAFVTFKLALIFENKESENEDQEDSGEPADELNVEGKTSEGEAQA